MALEIPFPNDEASEAAVIAQPSLGDLIPALKELLLWAEQHPELPQPEVQINFGFYGDAPEKAKQRLGQIARALPKSTKEYGSWSFRLEYKFHSSVVLNARSYREAVCTKRVVGTKVIPAYSAPERTEEIVEWDCSDGILSDKPKASDEPTSALAK